MDKKDSTKQSSKDAAKEQFKPIGKDGPKPDNKPVVKEKAIVKEAEGFNYLVRIMNTDLDGKKPVLYALTKIKGVSIMFANAICRLAKVNMAKRIGDMGEAEIKSVDAVLRNPDKIPVYMYNRQNDYETGSNSHLIMADLTFTQDNDIKRLKMIKSRRGLRHQWGFTVRGQSTHSHFRKNKTANSKKKKKK